MLKTRLALAAGISALAICLLTAPAVSGAPRLANGIYDCMAYNWSTGFLDYKGSVKLKGKNRYEHGFGRKKRRIEDKTEGTYRRAKRGRIVFSRGALNRTVATVEKGDTRGMKPFFNLLWKGKPSGISCYYVKRP